MLTAGRFAVNVLGWEQRELATRLADRTRTPAQRFAGIRESTRVTGSPVVQDSLAVFDCLLAQVWPCGDHMLLVGDVVGGSAERVDEPLLFYEGEFCMSAILPSGAIGSAKEPRQVCATPPGHQRHKITEQPDSFRC
jgi:flavin reductase (DIM6/NTAB) family NADH-FMN oxidoreductase RutF